MGKNIAGFERQLNEVKAEALPFGAEMHGKWPTRGGWAAKSHIVTKTPDFQRPSNKANHARSL